MATKKNTRKKSTSKAAKKAGSKNITPLSEQKGRSQERSPNHHRDLPVELRKLRAKFCRVPLQER
jgi:hypothetical protein